MSVVRSGLVLVSTFTVVTTFPVVTCYVEGGCVASLSVDTISVVGLLRCTGILCY